MADNKKTLKLNHNFNALQSIVFFWFFLILTAGGVVTQGVAWVYAYPSEFGNPLFAVLGISIYQPLQFFIWAVNYPTGQGIIYGWFAMAVILLIGFVRTSFIWIRRGLYTDNSHNAHGSAEWGDLYNPAYDLFPKDGGLVLGKTFKGDIVSSGSNTHVIIAAPTGTGKSAGPAVMTLLSSPWSILVTDIKGELYKLTAGFRSGFSDVHEFNPVSFNHTTRINVLLEITLGLKSIEDAKALANALIIVPEKTSDTHWITKAQEWLTSLLLYILYCEEDIENKHIGHLYSLVSLGAHSNMKTGFGDLLKKCHIKRQGTEIDAELAEIEKYMRASGSGIVEVPEREAGSIVSSMSKFLDKFRLPQIIASMKNPNYSLREMLYNKRPQTLYITAPPSSMDAVSPVIRAVIEMLNRFTLEKEPIIKKTGEMSTVVNKFSTKKKILDSLLRRPPAPNIHKRWPKLKDRQNLMLLIDEAPRYGFLSGIEESIGVIRSYGVRVVFITQSILVLQNIYGEHSQVFVNSGIKLFLSANELKEAKYISDMCGQATTAYFSQGTSREAGKVLPGTTNRNANYVSRALLHSDEVMRLDEMYGVPSGLLFIEGAKPLVICRVFYTDYPELVTLTKIPIPSINITDEGIGELSKKWEIFCTDGEPTEPPHLRSNNDKNTRRPYRQKKENSEDAMAYYKHLLNVDNKPEDDNWGENDEGVRVIEHLPNETTAENDPTDKSDIEQYVQKKDSSNAENRETNVRDEIANIKKTFETFNNKNSSIGKKVIVEKENGAVKNENKPAVLKLTNLTNKKPLPKNILDDKKLAEAVVGQGKKIRK